MHLYKGYNNTRGVGRKSLLLMLMAVLYLSLLAWLGKGRLQGRLNIQSNAAALRAFMRQRWYIQARELLLFVACDSNKVIMR